MKKEIKDKLENIFIIVVGIIFMIWIIFMTGHVLEQFQEPFETIQDQHYYCCYVKPNATYSQTGDSCESIINNIYGGQC